MLQKDKIQSKKNQNFKKRRYTRKMFYQRFKSFIFSENTTSLMVTKEITLHLQHFIKLRKKIKKLRRVGFLTIKPKIWIIFNFNKILSRKGKNARMGKGRGDFCSWLIHLKKYSTIIRFYDINEKSVLALSKFFTKITNIKFTIK